MRKLTRIIIGGASAIAATIGLAGCTGAGGGFDASDGLQIVTTTTQLTDFAENITEGTEAEITGLLKPNGSAHHFEANAADLETIRNADVVIFNGMGLEEPWLDEVLDSSGFDGVRIDASTNIDPAEIIEGGDDHEHGEEGHGHEGETAEEESAEAHDHGEANPHIWTSPLVAATMVETVVDELAAADSERAGTYEENGAAYTGKLDELHEWIAANIDTIPEDERLLVTNHNALTYYEVEYGITFVGSVMPSWDDNAEPSAAEINLLVKNIEESGVQAVFTETQLNPATAESIANEAGVKVYSGEDALYTDALGEEGSTGATYIQATIHNTTQLLDSWGGSATEVPADLQGA
ncbi:metal ABC transporter substrate-binding protein [Gulosibacter sp. 10]|uniref:metal ABC transporter substrate-binding protein n=1 Tax=Gulosibacter sp. 10 TaxID=1255570 RepID=UPI00097F320E|nr:metal ABC transporter substrate-binding protein [Gulosibacter sp. 10]SJM67590.1 Manganese ABC transporter, periplasmic-binding protein SitA [Gulosibacter sp. 10]